MLALLWMGAVYIPLDVTLPAKRHHAMMNACKPKLLIFHGPTSTAVEALLDAKEGRESGTVAVPTCNLAEITYSSDNIASQNGAPLAVEAIASDEEDYSFILFTSGSTGTPKGIKLSQAGIMNYAASKSTLLGITPGVRVLQQSSPGFDMAIAQAFNAFANAGTLIVAPLQARGDPTMIAQLMASEAVEFTLATPTEYLMLTNYANDILRECKAWRYACSGGETVTEGLINELQRLELRRLALTDCYGPTEISCAATFRKIRLVAPMAEEGGDDICGESLSVGRPLPNISVYIVGDDGQVFPSGQPGEICIGGCGVARGYLDETLNLGKFVQNPFATREDIEKGWRTMYRTGDKGCLLPDGSLVFLGRKDLELVKLRGLRIELGEISSTILDASNGALTDAIVTVRGQPEFLVAHVAFAQGITIDEQRKLLAGLLSDLPLPRYMVPSFIIPLERLPTTPNGKVDRLTIASLPLPQTNEKEQDTAPQPLTVAQGELRLLWKEVLGDTVIRADTDFFTVGGSSLLLVRLQSLMKERMGVQIPLHELYRASTLCRMAALASHERSLVVEEAIDWEQETAIPPETQRVLHCVSNTPSLSPSSHLRILLTGATGFLGSEILRALIAEQDVVEIHCIAVPIEKQQTLLDLSNKLTVYTGSLLSPTLGLSSTEQHLLQTNMHCIIHAGSQGHCLNNYGSVKQANYISTQFLVFLALPHRIPIHFISSPRVILQSGSCTSTERSLAEYPPSGDGSQGFTASKWASERFLERVVATQEQLQNPRPLSVVIHRACSLIGDRASHDDAMNSVIRYSVLSGTVPHLPNAQGFFDFKDVLEVARDIGRGAAASALAAGVNFDDSSSGVIYQHHSSNLRVPFNELARRLETLHSGNFTIVSMSEWLRTAVELGIEELIVSYLEANLAGGGTLMFPYLGE
jgi:aspyridone synthetase (hybrid polyketide synthase/nonribosomal peptide synthetase)